MKVGIDLAPLTYTLTGIGVYLQQYLVAASRLEQEITWHFPVRSLIPFETWFRGRMAGKMDEELNSRISIDPKFAFFHERRRKNEAEHLCRGEMDLFHITNAQSQFATFETPFVITVHDLAWKRVPKKRVAATSCLWSPALGVTDQHGGSCYL